MREYVTQDCVHELLDLAATLDPRYKNHLNNDKTKAIGMAGTRGLTAVATEEDGPTQGPLPASAGSGDDVREFAKKSFGSYFIKAQDFRKEVCIPNTIGKEIKSYLKIAEVDRTFPQIGGNNLCIPLQLFSYNVVQYWTKEVGHFFNSVSLCKTCLQMRHLQFLLPV